MIWMDIVGIMTGAAITALVINKAKAKKNAGGENFAKAEVSNPAGAFAGEEAPKLIRWIPAESVSEGGTYYEPLTLEYNGLRYESTDSDPMVMSVLIEANIDKKLVVPDGIRGIGMNAFRNFPQLEEIVLPDSVKRCDTYAFSCSEKLISVTLPPGLTELEYGLFKNCKKLKSVTVPDGVNEISHYVFSGCESLETVELSDSVSRIGEGAFKGCKSLGFVHLPSLLCSVMNEAFYECSALREITLPAAMSCIPERCFDCCHGLEYIVLKGEKNIWSIGESAFAGCGCDIFVEAPSFDEEKLAQSHTSIERESGMWWEEYHQAWDSAFTGKAYFAGQWHYDENGKPVKNQLCGNTI